MPDIAAAPKITFAELVAPGWAAVKKYWRPFLLLQSSAFLLVAAYYMSDRVRNVCVQLSDFKQHAGLLFSAVVAALAGGLLPEFAKALVLGDRQLDRQRLRNIGFNLFAFAINGVFTDAQYRGMAWVFGNDAHLLTVVKKILADQFITTPIYGTPYWLLIFSLRAHRFNLIATLREISPHWYAHTVLPLLISGWAFWIPMVALVYALPGPLQFCMYCFALAAWSLLMVFVATHQTEEAISTPAA